MENFAGSCSSQLRSRPLRRSSSSSTEDPLAMEVLFVIYGRGSSYFVKAIDKKGKQLSNYCFTIPYKSLPFPMGFAAVGSNLYMIGGETSRHSLDVYVFDVKNVSSLVDGCLSSDFIRLGPRLNGRKETPLVLSVRGFIYVLSLFLVLDEPYPNFEVLDPSHGAWVVLPEPPIKFNASKIPDGYHLEIMSHAVKDDRYIIISLSKKWGVYVFDICTRKWSMVGREPLPFYGKSVSLDGFYYAFCRPSRSPYSVVNVFSDVMCPPLGEIGVAASPNVFQCHLGEIVVMGDTVFTVRIGFTAKSDSDFESGNGSDHHMTIDRFKVRMVSDEGSSTLKPKAVKQRSKLRKLEDAVMLITPNLLYCVPMVLHCPN